MTDFQCIKKAVVIGAGVSGCVAARVLADSGYNVTIFERRNHVAGNAFDYFRNGVLLHKYGPHLFHTNSDSVVRFLKRFTDFFIYEHRVLGEIDGQLVPIPFNYKSMDMLFAPEDSAVLKDKLTHTYGFDQQIPILELCRSEDEQIRGLADFIYKKVFVGYTTKQWGIAPEEIDSAVMGRVPVRTSYDDRYFKDVYQLMPLNGYAEMFEEMLHHPSISLRLGYDALDFFQIKENQPELEGRLFEGPVIYTGCIDELLGYRFGRLPYRSLKFVLEDRPVKQALPTVQVNFPDSRSYTRISEFKLLQQSGPAHTVLTYEYPIPCGLGDIPYYPIENRESHELYNQYRTLLEPVKNLYCLGRLAQYRYYNMDQAVKNALDTAEKICLAQGGKQDE